METLSYSQIIISLLEKHLTDQPNTNSVETQLVIDPINHHYQLLCVGWQGEKRIYVCPVHVDIKDGKIWIQQDFTEAGIAQQLIDQGVPKSDIVLGFRSSFMRQLSDFAVG
jgi:hypothetical protein